MSHIPYLIVATDYATSCAGTCPTCVLTKTERTLTAPATPAEVIIRGLQAAGAAYSSVETLALGIGRANVLALPARSIADIEIMAGAAHASFKPQNLVLEVTTSLIGKIDTQITRALELLRAASLWNCDLRFVIVANTAIHSEKYWANVQTFYAAIAAERGGADLDECGEIIQLTLSLNHLPDPLDLFNRVQAIQSPININWTPAFEREITTDALHRMEAWLTDWFDLCQRGNLDSSLVNRTVQVAASQHEGLTDALAHAKESSRSLVYIAKDGSWHNGLFSVLAEIDPHRFDPGTRPEDVSGLSPKQLRSILTNAACNQCEFLHNCIASGAHRIALINLRSLPKHSPACPSGLRGCFSRARSTSEEL